MKFVENAQNQKNQKFSLMRRFDKLYNFYTNLENNKQKSFNINQQWLNIYRCYIIYIFI